MKKTEKYFLKAEKPAAVLIFTAAVLIFLTGMSGGPKTPEHYEKKALLYLEKNENTSAEKTAEEGINKFPSAAELYVILGRSMLIRGENERALDYFSKAVTLDGFNAEAVMYTGAAYYNMNDARAPEYLERSLEMNSDLKKARIMLGFYYLKNGKIKEGSGLLNEVSSQYIKLGELDKAEELTLEVFRRNPSDPMMLLNSGDMLYLWGDEEKAMKSWYFSINNGAENPGAYIRLGKHYLEKTQYDAAIQILEKCLDRAQGCRTGEVYYYLGSAYLYRGDEEKGSSILVEGIAADPEYAAGYTLLGSYYIDTGMVEKGIELIKDGIKRNPDDSKALLFVAAYKAEKGDYKEAAEYVEMARKADPDYATVYSIGAGIYKKRGNLLKAFLYDRKSKVLRELK